MLLSRTCMQKAAVQTTGPSLVSELPIKKNHKTSLTGSLQASDRLVSAKHCVLEKLIEDEERVICQRHWAHCPCHPQHPSYQRPRLPFRLQHPLHLPWQPLERPTSSCSDTAQLQHHPCLKLRHQHRARTETLDTPWKMISICSSLGKTACNESGAQVARTYTAARLSVV